MKPLKKASGNTLCSDSGSGQTSRKKEGFDKNSNKHAAICSTADEFIEQP